MTWANERIKRVGAAGSRAVTGDEGVYRHPKGCQAGGNVSYYNRAHGKELITQASQSSGAKGRETTGGGD